jgi:hypothetical protein
MGSRLGKFPRDIPLIIDIAYPSTSMDVCIISGLFAAMDSINNQPNPNFDL